MTHRTARSAVLAALLALSAALAFDAPSVEPKKLKQPPGPKVMPSLDKVTMESFVSDPAVVPPGSAQVTLKVTVKNVTNSTGDSGFALNGQKIRIYRTNPQPDVLELETSIVNLGPGLTQTVGAKVNIAPGSRDYFARVDPDDTLHEPLVQRANNEKRLKLTIPQASREQAPPPGSQAQLVTQFLDYEKAKQAGAQFSHGVEGSQGICVSVGQFDASLAGFVVGRTIPAGVLFSIDCAPGSLAVPNGARATPEAFMGFRLKNGWKVKEFAFGRILREAADWQWRKTPSKGTDDPSMRMHIWANPGGRLGVPVKVEIEGPAGTNPYQ